MKKVSIEIEPTETLTALIAATAALATIRKSVKTESSIETIEQADTVLSNIRVLIVDALSQSPTDYIRVIAKLTAIRDSLPAKPEDE